jgi:hypothetical protein
VSVVATFDKAMVCKMVDLDNLWRDCIPMYNVRGGDDVGGVAPASLRAIQRYCKLCMTGRCVLLSRERRYVGTAHSTSDGAIMLTKLR